VVDTRLFVGVEGEQGRRVLAEGRVVRGDDASVTVHFADGVSLRPGTQLPVYKSIAGQFFQQPAVVVGGGPEGVRLHLVGPAKSAERRRTFRACPRDRHVPVGVEGFPDCDLADISPEGVGVVSIVAMPVGAYVQARFEIDGHPIDGSFVVHCAKTLPCGRTRYGLKVPGRPIDMTRRLRAVMNVLQNAGQLRDAA
jgi:hypothetical protein